jgi:predicted membrane protein
MGSGIFWGLLLILIGIIIIIKVVFRVDIPVFRLLFALLFIYIGLRILFGGAWFSGKDNNYVFTEAKINTVTPDDRELKIIFAQGDVDLTGYKAHPGDNNLEISVVFGSSKITLPEKLPVSIESDVVFGSAKLPGGRSAAFGSTQFKSPGYEDKTDRLHIKLNVVFGSADVYQ